VCTSTRTCAEAAAQAVAAHVEGVKDIVLDLYARHHAQG
jgi:hypothetical protein